MSPFNLFGALISTAEAAGFRGSVTDMIISSGPVAKAALFVLFFFSVTSWAIIAYKILLMKRIRREDEFFLDLFRNESSFGAVYVASKKATHSIAAKVFLAGYYELKRADINPRARATHNPPQVLDKAHALDGQRIERTLSRAISAEIAKLEGGLTFLATTGSTTPFIGLFGTVWGIMDAFRAIGLKGSANLASVAPGISEALIATAAGLAAAIPAVVAYNYFLSRIKFLATEMDSFASEYADLIETRIGKSWQE